MTSRGARCIDTDDGEAYRSKDVGLGRLSNRCVPRYAAPVSLTTLRVTIGRIVLVAGVLVLLFIPYLLWGTGLSTAQTQDHLRSELASQAPAVRSPGPLRPGLAPPVVAPPTTPPATGAPVAELMIPNIGLSMVVVEGTGTEQLRAGPGHYPNTPLPGEAGNSAIAGHRTTYLHPFGDLDRLVAGDRITVATTQGLFLYAVSSSEVVSPTDVAVVGPTPTPTLTLTTCNPRYSARTRLIVHAHLVASVLSGSAPPNSPAAPVLPRSNSAELSAATPAEGSVGGAIAWGAAVAVLITIVWWLALRVRGARRVAVVIIGLAAWLAVVLGFFQALAPLLPASF